MTLDKPKQVEYYKLQANRAKIGLTFKGDQKKVLEAFATMGENAEVSRILGPLASTQSSLPVADIKVSEGAL